MLIVAAGDHPAAVARDGHAVNINRMCVALRLLAGLDVPQAGSGIPAGGKDLATVRMERDAPDLFRVTAQDLFFLARNQVPDAHRLIESTGGGILAVVGESHAFDFVRMSFELAQF